MVEEKHEGGGRIHPLPGKIIPGFLKSVKLGGGGGGGGIHPRPVTRLFDG